jgi:hypothetical protein
MTRRWRFTDGKQLSTQPNKRSLKTLVSMQTMRFLSYASGAAELGNSRQSQWCRQGYGLAHGIELPANIQKRRVDFLPKKPYITDQKSSILSLVKRADFDSQGALCSIKPLPLIAPVAERQGNQTESEQTLERYSFEKLRKSHCAIDQTTL